MRSRYSKRSITITRSAPSIFALAAANCPTGTAPQIAITSPRLISQNSAPMYPVGKMSDRNSTDSSGMPFSILIGPDVGERDAYVLGLPAGEAARQVRVAEDPRGRMAEHLLGEPCVRIRVLAQRVQLVLARVAVAARDRERHDDAVADLEVRDGLALFDDLAHELVTEDVAALHRRDVAVEKVEVRAADRGRGDADDRVAVVQDRRVG